MFVLNTYTFSSNFVASSSSSVFVSLLLPHLSSLCPLLLHSFSLAAQCGFILFFTFFRFLSLLLSLFSFSNVQLRLLCMCSSLQACCIFEKVLLQLPLSLLCV